MVMWRASGAPVRHGVRRMKRFFFLSGPLLVLLACGGSPSGQAEGGEEPNPAAADGANGGPSATSNAVGSDQGSTTTASGGGPTETAGSSTATAAGSGGGGGSSATTGGSAGNGPSSDELAEALAAVADLDAEAFAERTRLGFESLDYDPSQAAGLDLIQNSDLGMTEAELAKFQSNGFVISTSKVFPHFSYGYASIYAQDLPLYISADSILYAMHTTYADILKSFEEWLLVVEVGVLLDELLGALAASSLPSDLQHDLDVFLSVARSLLAEEISEPLFADNAALIASLYDSCTAASGTGKVTLFGGERELDFSQFKPRGHYADSAKLRRYFRTMIWLGRTDLRLLEPDASGQLQLNRRQTEAALALRTLMNDEAKRAYEAVDDVVTAFVGEHDYMTAPELDDLMSDLGIAAFADLTNVSDAALAQAIASGGYGVQRISSQIMMGGLGAGGTATPLPASFALFGQRYVIDSHVFSNVVYDRVLLEGPQRLMPSPLDVAYAALGNDQAGMLLAPELETYDYASALASMRTVVDSEAPEVWQLNLYNRWLDALRSLSPTRAWATEEGETLPQIAKTEAWGRRILNTQMASWAELRHDTILYTKQSYTAAGTCEYPDAYVDPYPAFYIKVAGFAAHALGIMAKHGFVYDESAAPSFDLEDPDFFKHETIRRAQKALQNFVDVCGILAEMAEHQRTGAPHSEEHMAFVNQTVAIETGCGGGAIGASGWYAGLFVNDASAIEWAPTIADVHTQPDDGTGSPVGKVLHVGTGDIRLMLTSVESCSGPRAYAGLVSSYYERIEADWERLDDSEWEALLRTEPLASPEWVTSLTAE